MIRTALGAVADFIRDGTHGSPERTEAGVPVLSAMNVKGGRLNFETDRFTSNDEFAAFSRRVPLSDGDVLLTIVGTIGRAAVIEEVRPLVFQRSVAIIRPKAAVLDSRFLYHATQSSDFQTQLDRASNKSSQAGVYLGKLAEVLIPLPSLAEQRRIAAILDQADALRAKRREALAQLDRLTQAIFTDMFGDPVTGSKGCIPKTLADCVTKLEYGPRFYNEAYSQDGVRIVRITDLDHSGALDFSSMPRMEVPEEIQEQHLLAPGDLVFARTGATVGKAALIGESDPPCIAGAYFIRLRFNPSVLPVYAFSVLRSRSVQALIAAQSRQAAQQNFSGPGLRSLPMPVPDLEMQKAFAKRVARIRIEQQRLTDSQVVLDELFASLQHRAFRGEL